MWKIQDIVSGQKGFQGFFKESAWLSSGLAVGSKRGIILVPRWPRLRILRNVICTMTISFSWFSLANSNHRKRS